MAARDLLEQSHRTLAEPGGSLHRRNAPRHRAILFAAALGSSPVEGSAEPEPGAANEGPVFITVRGRPAHVLLTIEAYRKLTHKTPRIADLLAMPGIEDIAFEPTRAGQIFRPSNLSSTPGNTARRALRAKFELAHRFRIEIVTLVPTSQPRVASVNLV